MRHLLCKLLLTMVKGRILYIDGLRGGALLGVSLAHMFEQYLGNIPSKELSSILIQGLVDQFFYAFYSIAVVGKFYMIFSFLFGLSFSFMLNKPIGKKTISKQRFLWRLVLLFIIGFGHHLFYRADILMVYSILGVVLMLIYKNSSRFLLLLAIFCMSGIPRFIIYFFAQPDSYMIGLPGFLPGSESYTHYVATVLQGSLLDLFEINFRSGGESIFQSQFGVVGRAYSTFAMFICGVLMGRGNNIQTFNQNKAMVKKVAFFSAMAFMLTSIPLAFLVTKLGENLSLNSWLEMLLLSLYDISNLSVSILYVSLFCWIYRKSKALESYGQMALTNYIAQSVFGSFIFYGWGFGLLGQLQYGHIALIAFLILSTQLFFSFYWMSFFKAGPLEWLWRSLIYRKIQPLIR